MAYENAYSTNIHIYVQLCILKNTGSFHLFYHLLEKLAMLISKPFLMFKSVCFSFLPEMWAFLLYMHLYTGLENWLVGLFTAHRADCKQARGRVKPPNESIV